jgi:hypothetical protein
MTLGVGCRRSDRQSATPGINPALLDRRTRTRRRRARRCLQQNEPKGECWRAEPDGVTCHAPCVIWRGGAGASVSPFRCGAAEPGRNRTYRLRVCCSASRAIGPRAGSYKSSLSIHPACAGRARATGGASGRIRTCGLWLRRPTLYSAELRAHSVDGRCLRSSRWRQSLQYLSVAGGVPEARTALRTDHVRQTG